MAGLEIKNQGSPDETRSFGEMGRVELWNLGGRTLGREVLKPGWRWSEHVQPMTGRPFCEVTHVGFCIAGRLKLRTRDGEEAEVGPGDSFYIEGEHDAWVLGSDDFVAVDFGDVQDYARRSQEAAASPPPIH